MSHTEPPVLADQRSDVASDEIQVLARTSADLERLGPEPRARVLEYLVARFLPQRRASWSGETRTPNSSRAGVESVVNDVALDVRSFTEEKQPANGQEMAAVLAYYLAEAAPEGERRETITPNDIEKYFKQAGFPLPARRRSVLFNAKSAGYLEESSVRGEYKLSPVGYNLVTHRLPRGGEGASSSKTFRRRSRRPATKVNTPVAGSQFHEQD